MHKFIIEEEKFESLKGKTLTSIDIERNCGEDFIQFVDSDGNSYRMDHSQECCENVYIADINGDVQDLLGSPILVAEERTVRGNTEHGIYRYTFYELRTIKASVTIRWNGTSNGYYSISVVFYKE